MNAVISKEEFKRSVESKIQRMFGRSLGRAKKSHLYKGIAMVVRDLINERWAYSREAFHEEAHREAFYLSMEFLTGRTLGNNLMNLGLEPVVREVCEELGVELDEIREMEPDAGLGNGGLGRLAACFMDSLTTLGLPGHGCGIRYEYGLFKQKIIDGYQIEMPDPWLEDGSIWEVAVPEEAEIVKFGGWVETTKVGDRIHYEQKGCQTVRAVPYEIPVVGYGSELVNSLRLWAARSTKHLDMGLFGQGRYMDALEEKELAEVISKVLYPEDNHPEGKALRLKQQYFFTSASIQSIVHTFKRRGGNMRDFAKRTVIHINDTHPALAIPELMRILLDEDGMDWDEAWEISRNTFAYTNHTILEEALEKWPVELFQSQLPRLWDIVYEINEQFCGELWERYPGDWDKIASMAVIAENQVKMAHLCIVGSFSVNGVAQLHADILKKHVFRDFHEFYPHKVIGITNGVTFRRFLLKANPELADLISGRIGQEWITDSEQLKGLESAAADPEFNGALQAIRRRNKENLAQYILENNNIVVDPQSIFDVQIKRLHEYKRQLMNVLHIMHLYNELRDNPNWDMHPRTFIFAAKAAPGYRMAKLIIKLTHSVGQKINNDPRIKGKLKVVFLENYRVSLAEKIIPASDVSEQISTAGKEASGTGNMKFMLNGALTIGTLDGANVEILDAVGPEAIYIFGLTAEETNAYYGNGHYNPRDSISDDVRLQRVLDQLVNDSLNVGSTEVFRELHHGLLYAHGMADPYFVLKDFDSYAAAHAQINHDYQRPEIWWPKAVRNIANAGRFSSDRTINEYNERIWRLPHA